MTSSPADRVARILHIERKSAVAFCLEVENEYKGFSLSADLIATYLERNPNTPADPCLIAEQLGALVCREIERIARLLHCDATDAMLFCYTVQQAFPDNQVPLKHIAECVKRFGNSSVTPRLAIRELGGSLDLADLDLRPAPRPRGKHPGDSELLGPTDP